MLDPHDRTGFGRRHQQHARPVGARHRCSALLQHRERPACRVTVPVLGADGEEREPGVQAVVERGALIGRPVMGDLDDIDAGRGPGRRGRDEGFLLALPEIAEEQRAECSALGAHDQAACIPAELRGAGRGGGRPDDPPPDTAEFARHPLVPVLDTEARRCQALQERPVGGAVGFADDDPVGPLDHGIHPAGVIGVVMGQEHPLETPEAEGVQAGGHRFGAPPHVDEGRSVAVAQHERVALTDVARRDQPGIGSAERSPEFCAAEGAHVDRAAPDERDRRRRSEHARHSAARCHERDGDQHQHAQHDAGHPLRPRQRGPGQAGRESRDQGDPGRREPGDPDHQLTHGRSPGKQEARHAAEHRSDGCGRLCDEVRRDAEQRQRGRQQDEHRLTGELRCGRHSEGQRDARGQPARQSGRQRPGEQQQTGGRESREREAVVT